MHETPCIVSRDLARYEEDMERYDTREIALALLMEDLRDEFQLLDPIHLGDGASPWLWEITREGHGVWDDGRCDTEAQAKLAGSKAYSALLRREAEARIAGNQY